LACGLSTIVGKRRCVGETYHVQYKPKSIACPYAQLKLSLRES
jgi:hypothetical protein